jgi:hypothetical protein
MTLDAIEFLRRFLQHVLPKGFVKIRHYGLLANLRGILHGAVGAYLDYHRDNPDPLRA